MSEPVNNLGREHTATCGCKVRRISAFGFEMVEPCDTHAAMLSVAQDTPYSLSRDVEKVYYPGEDHPRTFTGPVEDASTPVDEPGDNAGDK